MVLTLGALLAEVPHSRPTPVFGNAYDEELTARLDLEPSRYEGATGIVGVLHAECAAAQAWTQPRCGRRFRRTFRLPPRRRPPSHSSSAPSRSSAPRSPTMGLTLEAAAYEHEISQLVAEDETTLDYVHHLEELHDTERHGGRARPTTWSKRWSGSCVSRSSHTACVPPTVRVSPGRPPWTHAIPIGSAPGRCLEGPAGLSHALRRQHSHPPTECRPRNRVEIVEIDHAFGRDAISLCERQLRNEPATRSGQRSDHDRADAICNRVTGQAPELAGRRRALQRTRSHRAASTAQSDAILRRSPVGEIAQRLLAVVQWCGRPTICVTLRCQPVQVPTERFTQEFGAIDAECLRPLLGFAGLTVIDPKAEHRHTRTVSCTTRLGYPPPTGGCGVPDRGQGCISVERDRGTDLLLVESASSSSTVSSSSRPPESYAARPTRWAATVRSGTGAGPRGSAGRDRTASRTRSIAPERDQQQPERRRLGRRVHPPEDVGEPERLRARRWRPARSRPR